IMLFFVFLIGACYLYDSDYKAINRRIFYKLGLWSYSIYISHMLYINIVRFILSKFNLNNGYLDEILAMGLTVGGSWLTYLFIEIKIGKLLKELLFKVKRI